MKKKDKTYYQILGVQHDASAQDIKRAYREIAKAQHPDVGHHSKTEKEIAADTEEMLRINEAYETLTDKSKRAKYDLLIGVTIQIKQEFQFSKNNEDEARQIFLAKVFYPSRNSINKVLSNYTKQLRVLSQDPFDDELVEGFEHYLNEIEAALRKASKLFASTETPATLEPAALMMRHCIAQAVDALEETRRYCQNYDYSHLATAESLFRIATDLSKQAYALTKHV
ncbi:MAG: DnaJ domain-containing protein [Candidatus Obscuribacterales bacterium]|nr:DnaJ domain-containing protein [Candidatus Obscuribacterales bacterium]